MPHTGCKPLGVMGDTLRTRNNNNSLDVDKIETSIGERCGSGFLLVDAKYRSVVTVNLIQSAGAVQSVGEDELCCFDSLTFGSLRG